MAYDRNARDPAPAGDPMEPEERGEPEPARGRESRPGRDARPGQENDESRHGRQDQPGRGAPRAEGNAPAEEPPEEPGIWNDPYYAEGSLMERLNQALRRMRPTDDRDRR